MAGSIYGKVNGRGHRTHADKANCAECKQFYTDWKFIGKDGRCYKCHGVSFENNQALIKFIEENQEVSK